MIKLFVWNFFAMNFLNGTGGWSSLKALKGGPGVRTPGVVVGWGAFFSLGAYRILLEQMISMDYIMSQKYKFNAMNNLDVYKRQILDI